MTNHAKDQARAQLESVIEMAEALQAAMDVGDDDALEDAERRIQEDALSVELRRDWYIPGSSEDPAATHFRVLLCTGGPAVQIYGSLTEHAEPDVVFLQYQDWGTGWTDYPITGKQGDAIKLYLSRFYFGE
jgi:hypothetical protein